VTGVEDAARPELEHAARRRGLGEARQGTSRPTAIDDLLGKGEAGGFGGGLGAVRTRSSERSKQLPLTDQQVKRPAAGAAYLKGAGGDGEALVTRGTHRKPAAKEEPEV
jgi:hypothetical protein